MEDDKINALVLFAFRDFLEDIVEGDELDEAMSSGDSENGPLELELLCFVDDSVVYSQNALVVVNLTEIILLLVKAGDYQIRPKHYWTL